MEATLTIGGVSATVKMFARKSKSSGKDGFGLLGRVSVNGVEHMVNGFVSPVTPMSADEKAEKAEFKKAFEASWKKKRGKANKI